MFLFSFLFSFFSVSASWIPRLWYENILNYSIESKFWQVWNSVFREVLTLRHCTNLLLWEWMTVWKWSPLAKWDCGKARGDYFCKGVLLVCPPWKHSTRGRLPYQFIYLVWIYGLSLKLTLSLDVSFLFSVFIDSFSCSWLPVKLMWNYKIFVHIGLAVFQMFFHL